MMMLLRMNIFSVIPANSAAVVRITEAFLLSVVVVVVD